MVAYPHAAVGSRLWRVHWWRLPLAALVVAAVSAGDTIWKSAALAGSTGLDTPSTLLRPLTTSLVGLVAVTGVLLLPRLCLPGALLIAGGMTSNLVSLALWGAVPDPFHMGVAGGVVHFNPADLCIWGGGMLFFAAVCWTVWRMPPDHPALSRRV